MQIATILPKLSLYTVYHNGTYLIRAEKHREIEMNELNKLAKLITKYEQIEKARWSKISDWSALRSFCNGRHLNDAIYETARQLAIKEIKAA